MPILYYEHNEKRGCLGKSWPVSDDLLPGKDPYIRGLSRKNVLLGVEDGMDTISIDLIAYFVL